MDEFYNANNRCWNMYLNVVKMYQYSLFANARVIATSAPMLIAPTMNNNAKQQQLKLRRNSCLANC